MRGRDLNYRVSDAVWGSGLVGVAPYLTPNDARRVACSTRQSKQVLSHPLSAWNNASGFDGRVEWRNVMSGLTTHGFPRELSLTALRRRLSIDVANAPAVPLGAAQRRILQLQRELRARPKRADDAQRRRAELEARVAAADRTHQATLDGVNLAFTSEIDAVRAVQAAELRRAQAAAKADLAGLVSELAAATLTAERVAADAAAARAELVEEHARAKQHFANELGVAAAQKDGLTSTVQAAARKHVAAEGLVARLRDEIVATQSAATQSTAAAAAEQRAIAAQGDVLRRCTSDAMSAVAEAALLLRNQLAHEGVVVGGNDEDAPAPDAVVELTVVELAAAAMPQLEPQPELLFTATTGDAADGDGDDAIQRRIVESATFLTGGVSVSGGDELHSHSHSQSHSQPQLPGDEAASVRVQLQATNVVEVEDDARLVQQVEAKVYLLKGRVEQFLSHHVAGRTQLALSLDEAQGKVTAERSATAAAETFALAAREEALKAQVRFCFCFVYFSFDCITELSTNIMLILNDYSHHSSLARRFARRRMRRRARRRRTAPRLWLPDLQSS